MDPRHRSLLNQMWDLHARREKLTDRLRPMRVELSHMHAHMILAKSRDEAAHIYQNRRRLKAEFQTLSREYEEIDRKLSRLSQAIPGNYVVNVDTGREKRATVNRVPEEYRNFTTGARIVG